MKYLFMSIFLMHSACSKSILWDSALWTHMHSVKWTLQISLTEMLTEVLTRQDDVLACVSQNHREELTGFCFDFFLFLNAFSESKVRPPWRKKGNVHPSETETVSNPNSQNSGTQTVFFSTQIFVPLARQTTLLIRQHGYFIPPAILVASLCSSSFWIHLSWAFLIRVVF